MVPQTTLFCLLSLSGLVLIVVLSLSLTHSLSLSRSLSLSLSDGVSGECAVLSCTVLCVSVRWRERESE